jgi:hypothetical protein
MTKQMKIPDELEWTFQNLINLHPDPLKGEDHTQQIILACLNFGGEKLARQGIEIIKIHFREKAVKEPSETRTPLDFNVAGSHISESDLSESDSLEFPTK